MLDVLFEPLWKMQTCYGPHLNDLTCYNEVSSYFTVPIVIIILVSGVGLLFGKEKYDQWKKRRVYKKLGRWR